MGYNILSSVSQTFANLVGKYVAVANVDSTEVLTTEGRRFNQHFDEVFSGNETKYFLYEVPSDATVTVGFQNRIFKSRDGAAELDVYWESTGFTPGTPEDVFNEYNKYSDNNQLLMSEISEPTTLGIHRESDFVTASGVGSNTSGDVSAALGFRLYEPGTFAVVKVTNLDSSANRIILSYSWVEIVEGLLAP